MELFAAQSKDFPKAVLHSASKAVGTYTTPLVLEGQLAGSGTFVKCGKVSGILTAHHVVHNPRDPDRRFDFRINSTQRLGLVLDDFPHAFELEMRHLVPIDIGIPPVEGEGPDLTVLKLPDVVIGKIEAFKSFYNLNVSTEKRLEEALRDDGLFLGAGHPGVYTELVRPSLGFGQVVHLPGVGLCTGVKDRTENAPFDYLRVEVNYGGVSEAPETFGGVSGGGVWRIPIYLKPDDPPESMFYRDLEIYLAGVAFVQERENGQVCALLCHAARSVYNMVRAALNNFSASRDGPMDKKPS